MPALAHTFLLVLAVGASYWWVSVPELNMYSLQAIGMVSLIYFLLKRLAKAKFWHVMPAALSIETALATFAFLILIGATGNTSSLLFPLSYVHLFLIAFSSSGLTSIIITVAVGLFHYALNPALTNELIVSLITLPLVMLFFLFAKRQHEEVVRDRIIIAEENSELEQIQAADSQLGSFVQTIQAKLQLLSQQLTFPLVNMNSVQEQLSLVQIEMAKLEEYLQKRWFMLTNATSESAKPYEKPTS